jgi:RNA polymerase sigma-70 factor (ECF subfamily)
MSVVNFGDTRRGHGSSLRGAAPKNARFEEAEEFKAGLVAALPALRAFARSLSLDSHRADDLVQETALKAWSARDQFAHGTNLQAWLFTILRNTFFSDCRRTRREVEDPEGQLAESSRSRRPRTGHSTLSPSEARLLV